MIEIIQKNGYSRRFECSIIENGVSSPRDLTGYNLVFILKRLDDFKNDDTDALLKTTTATVSPDAQNGIVDFDLISSQTNLPFGTYKCEFQLEKNAEKITLTQEEFVILENYIKV